LVISASSHPLPPSRGRSALDPSALPAAKQYTYFGARVDLVLGLTRFDVRAAVRFITTLVSPVQVAGNSRGSPRALMIRSW
jgi:hypothetical protein